MVNVSIEATAKYKQYCDIREMREDPSGAMLAHFHGPLTIGPRTINWKLPGTTVLKAGDDDFELNAVVGTMSAKHGCWVAVRSGEGERRAFPKGVHPVAEIAFTPVNGEGKLVRQEFQLDQFC